MKKTTLKFVTKGILLGLLVLPVSMALSHTKASAVAEIDPISYMNIYSSKGTYTRARIQFITNGSTPHRCAGADLTNGSTVSIKLYVSRPHKIQCAAVDGSNSYYKITFLKGKKNTNNSADYKQLQNSGNDLFAQVDVNQSTVKPYKSCTSVYPTTGWSATAANVSNSCSTNNSLDTIPKDDSEISMSLRGTTNVSLKTGPVGKVIVSDYQAWDGVKYASKTFCRGIVTVYYQRADNSNSAQAFNKPMRFKDGKCEARFSSDKVVYSKNTQYKVWATFAGNNYLNAPQPAQQMSPIVFTTKK